MRVLRREKIRTRVTQVSIFLNMFSMKITFSQGSCSNAVREQSQVVISGNQSVFPAAAALLKAFPWWTERLKYMGELARKA